MQILMNEILVLMSTYNGDKYLRQQIESLLKQSIAPKIKILVRDDGSTDKTLSILDEYKKNNKLNYYKGLNIGSTKSFFELLKNAPKSNYYAFCDQDDYWLHNKLEVARDRIIKENKENKPMLYFCSKYITDEKLNKMDRKDVKPKNGVLNAFLKNNEAFGCTMVFNHSLKKIFDKYMPCQAEFHDSWIYKLAIVFGKIIYDDQAYILYRQHDKNVTGAHSLGKKLWIERMRKIQYYPKRSTSSKYAQDLLIGYEDKIPLNISKIVRDIAMAKINYRARIRLFMTPGLDSENKLEYIGIKIFVLFGWL